MATKREVTPPQHWYALPESVQVGTKHGSIPLETKNIIGRACRGKNYVTKVIGFTSAADAVRVLEGYISV